MESSVGDQFNGDYPLPPPIVNNEGNKKRKLLAGFLVVCGIAICHCGTAQFAQSTSSENFYAPYFVTWFGASWMVLCFPAVFLVARFLASVRRTKPPTLRELLEQASQMFGNETSARIRQAILVGSAFTLIWVLSNYAYVRGLHFISGSAASAVFSSNTIFVFLLSAVFLGSNPVSFKLISVVLAVFGLFLIAFSDGFKSSSLGGVAMILCSAFFAALFTVTFKRFIGEGTFVQVGLFLSVIGALNTLVFWIFIPIADLAEEKLDRIPWFFLLGMAVLNLGFNFLVNFGVAITYPLFIALGMILGIPLNALVDTIVRDKAFGPFKVLGAIALIAAFVTAILLPDSLDRKLQQAVGQRAPSSPSASAQARYSGLSQQDQQRSGAVLVLRQDEEAFADAESRATESEFGNAA